MASENKNLLTRDFSEKWENLTFANNFIFYKVLRHHPEACKHIIEMLLDIKIEKMEMSSEESFAIDYDSKGIRLDVFVKDCDQMFDVELQVANTKELPERARYYQGLMDIDTLKSGQKYKELKNSHVIFLCMKDIFEKNMPVYTFENLCVPARMQGKRQTEFRKKFCRSEQNRRFCERRSTFLSLLFVLK